MSKTIADLISLLKVEANNIDEFSCSNLADGIYAAIRVISDEFSLDDIITSEVNNNRPIVDSAAFNAIKKTLLSRELIYQYQADLNLSNAANLCDFQKSYDEVKELRMEVNNLPSCQYCSGLGKVQSLQIIWDCIHCYGTGRDFTNYENVISSQQKIIVSQLAMLTKMAKKIYELKLAPPALTDEEKIRISVEEFYNRGRLMD